METIGARLKAARKAADFTLEELATAVDYTAGSISNVENENDKAGTRLIKRIVETLHINVAWLNSGDGPMFLDAKTQTASSAAKSQRSAAVKRIKDQFRESSRSVSVRDPEEAEEKIFFFDGATDAEWSLVRNQLEAAYQLVSKGKAPARKAQPSNAPKIIEFPLGHQLRPIVGSIAAGLPQEAVPQSDQWIALPPRQAAETSYILRVHGDSMIGAGIDHGDLLLMSRTKEPRNGHIVAALIDHETTLKRYVAKPRQTPYLHSENENYPGKIEPTEQLEIQGVMIGKLPQ